ncbi:cation-translocating P-type ATPase [Blautia sp. CLA-JM-H16]|uniref:Cd(2+)-exporting ATPase n=1 Tax=Blautia aquisgranensis TaxID=3133153 RepID=A0ABV1BDF1_9FIRM
MKELMKKWKGALESGGMKRDIVFLVISGISLLLSIFDVVPLPFDIAWVSILLCGIPIVLEALIGLVTEFDIKADVLVSLALIASVLIGEDFAAGEVAFIMQLGGLLEEITVARARAGIEKLIHLTPQTARIVEGEREEIIPAEEVEIGQILRILPGETIPVDGTILTGQTSVNQAVMTGESLPVDKTVGDEVASGTINQFGTFEMRAIKVGEDSSIQRMIRLVQSADAGKAKIVGLADRWATWIVVIALTAAVLTWILSGEIIRAVTILVVFCPCALVLATPTAIMAAIGNAAKHGILVREGDALERLAEVSRITFDKTGTLTHGTPKVIEVRSILPEYPEEKLFVICAAAESMSEHPLGKAVVNCYKEKHNEKLLTCESFKMVLGRGLFCQVEDKLIYAGNESMMREEDIVIPEYIKPEVEKQLNRGCTVIYIALNYQFAGYLALSDTIRKESISMLKKLKALQVKPVLLTGDNGNAATAIAGQLDIHEVHSNCMPEDKLDWIVRYQKQNEKVCMIGDGVNDAPALKKADVGIAMGKFGSDIAVDAADIALIDDEVKELPHLIALSKRMMITIKCNLVFSLSLNFLAIILAITGVLNPVVGALVHNAGSVLVIINSAMLLKWKKDISTESGNSDRMDRSSNSPVQILKN